MVPMTFQWFNQHISESVFRVKKVFKLQMHQIIQLHNSDFYNDFYLFMGFAIIGV